jgi:hypothetical protein
MGPFPAPGFESENAFNPLAYRIDLTRRRIKYRTSLAKKGLVGEEKEAPAGRILVNKPEGGGGAEAPAAEKKSGILAVAKSAEDQQYVEKVARHVDAIMLKADDASFKDLTSLVTEIRRKVQELEEECGIVVNVDEMEIDAKDAADLLENPLDSLGDDLGGMPPAEPPSKPPVAPGKKASGAPAAEGSGGPAAKAPSKTPAVPPKTETAPTAKKGPVAPPKKTAPPPQP